MLSIRLVAGMLAFSLMAGLTAAYGYSGDTTLIDPRSSEGKSGVETPRTYFIPPTPTYEKVDLQEYLDYRKTHVSPYAQLQLYRTVRAGTVTLPPGYYLIKLDLVRFPLFGTGNEPPPPEPALWRKVLGRVPKGGDDPQALQPPYNARRDYPAVTGENNSGLSPIRVTMLLKRAGSVEVAIPVAKSVPLIQNAGKQATAQLMIDGEDPAVESSVSIRYCVRHICYDSARLEPGLVE